jgi:membrane associated rhomboid family serine protease
MFFPIKVDGIPLLPAPAIAALMAILIAIHAINLLDPHLHLHSLLTAASPRLGYEVFTESLVHRNGLHLAMNLVYLYFFGNLICRALGAGAFLAVTVVAAGVTGLLDVALRVDAIGASDIASGLMGAALAAYPLRKFRFLYCLGFSNGVFGIALVWVVALAVVADLTGLIYYAVNSALIENIAYWDHVGGFVIGYVIAYAAIRDKILRRRQNQEPSIHGLLHDPRPLVPQIAKTSANGRMVDSWALFIFIYAIYSAIGIYLYMGRALPWRDTHTPWLFLVQLCIAAVVSLGVYWTKEKGTYLVIVVVSTTVLANLIFRLHFRVDMLFVLLWLLQGSVEKVFWPKIFLTRYPATVHLDVNEKRQRKTGQEGVEVIEP